MELVSLTLITTSLDSFRFLPVCPFSVPACGYSAHGSNQCIDGDSSDSNTLVPGDRIELVASGSDEKRTSTIGIHQRSMLLQRLQS